MKALRQEAVDLIASEAHAIVSTWKRVKGIADLAVHNAVDVLACWGALRRFDPHLVRRETLQELDDAVREDGELLARAVPEGLDPDEWIRAVEELAIETDSATEAGSERDVEERALRLFCELDDADLAAWGARYVAGSRKSASLEEPLEELMRGLARCWGAFANDPSLFLPAAPYADGLLSAFRKDLLRFDPELHGTSQKFRLLADVNARTSGSLDADPMPMSREEWEAMRSLRCRHELCYAAKEKGPITPLDAECLRFQANDGSWYGSLVVPREASGKVTIGVYERDGTRVAKGEMRFLGLPLVPVADGEGEISRAEDFKNARMANPDPGIELVRGNVASKGRIEW